MTTEQIVIDLPKDTWFTESDSVDPIRWMVAGKLDGGVISPDGLTLRLFSEICDPVYDL